MKQEHNEHPHQLHHASSLGAGLLHLSNSPTSTEKILRDQELHHLVTSSIPSPPYHHGHHATTAAALSLGSAGLVLDPIYSTHLFASLVAANAAQQAANPGASGGGSAAARFQLPIPLPLALQPATHLQSHLHHQRNLFHHLPGTTPAAAFAGLHAAGATLPSQAQLDILSGWVANNGNVAANNTGAGAGAGDDKKISSTTPNSAQKESGTGKNNKCVKKWGNGRLVSQKNAKNAKNEKDKKNEKKDKSGVERREKRGSKKCKEVALKSEPLEPAVESMPPSYQFLFQNNNGEAMVSSSENELPELKNAKVVVVRESGAGHVPGSQVHTIQESIIQPYILPASATPPGTPNANRLGKQWNGSPHNSPGNPNNHNNNNNNSSNNKNSSQTVKGSSTSPGSGAGAQNGAQRDKVFTCGTCHRCFGYKHVLQNHERTHTGEKPFECNICQKKFTRDHHLKTHMRLHTGEKPYQCTHCDRQFVQVANLRRHLRVHTGERPYQCELCSSRFSDSNQLKAHMLIHKGEKPYNCQECGGQFRRRHHLHNHKCTLTTFTVNTSPTCSDSSSPDPASPVATRPPLSTGVRRTSIDSSLEEMREENETSPPQLLTPSSTGTASNEKMGHEASLPGTVTPGGAGGGGGKRGRKCRETRRIIRLEGMGGGGAQPGFQVQPEQEAPEDLSMTGGLRVRHYSGSSSSVTASSTPSPRGPTSLLLLSSGGGLGGGRPYSSSSSFEEPPDLYGSEEEDMDGLEGLGLGLALGMGALVPADSSTNGKHTENESSSMSD